MTDLGTFVVFEGGEGSGKSTQAKLLADRRGALLTREPGGTDLGARIREIVLHADDHQVAPRAEALLMAADRAHHVATKIRPALEAGTDVISDRFMGSSVAYQGAGRSLGEDAVRDLSLFGTDNLLPDLVILVDVPVAVGRERAGNRGSLDKLEREANDFHERIRQAFLDEAARNPETWVVVDGAQSVEAVTAEIDQLVADRFAW